MMSFLVDVWRGYSWWWREYYGDLFRDVGRNRVHYVFGKVLYVLCLKVGWRLVYFEGLYNSFSKNYNLREEYRSDHRVNAGGDKWVEPMMKLLEYAYRLTRDYRFGKTLLDYILFRDDMAYVIEVKVGDDELALGQRILMSRAKELGFKTLLVRIDPDIRKLWSGEFKVIEY